MKKVYIENQLPKVEETEFKKQLREEAICPVCNVEMEETKRPMTNKEFGKRRTTYDCKICGFHHRQRTINEILRDIGERK